MRQFTYIYKANIIQSQHFCLSSHQKQKQKTKHKSKKQTQKSPHIKNRKKLNDQYRSENIRIDTWLEVVFINILEEILYLAGSSGVGV